MRWVHACFRNLYATAGVHHSRKLSKSPCHQSGYQHLEGPSPFFSPDQSWFLYGQNCLPEVLLYPHPLTIWGQTSLWNVAKWAMFWKWFSSCFLCPFVFSSMDEVSLFKLYPQPVCLHFLLGQDVFIYPSILPSIHLSMNPSRKCTSQIVRLSFSKCFFSDYITILVEDISHSYWIVPMALLSPCWLFPFIFGTSSCRLVCCDTFKETWLKFHSQTWKQNPGQTQNILKRF